MKKINLVSVLCVLSLFSANAQEGMWMLTQLRQLDLGKNGLLIPVEEIYDPVKPSITNAILQLGGGSASFVSSEGLVLTNHHVAFTALQRTSTADNDYITNGFLARDHSAEISAPGYSARLMLEMKDVTSEVLASAKGITDPVEKDKKIKAYITEVTDAVRAKTSDYEAEISHVYNGKHYIMYTYKVFKDIRIVYSPPLSIGNYGGETDNWMWPRHTGDFSFMRVYVSPDGKGEDFNKENIPYKPDVWLKVTRDDLDDGDFTFIIGYPGFTTRYRSSNSVYWNLNYNYPFYIDNFKEIISLSEELTENDPEGRIKIASLIKGLANTMKNYEGKVEGMERTLFLQKKLDFEKEYLEWANSTTSLKSKYADIISKEKEQYDILEKTRERDAVFGLIQGLSGTMLSVAEQIYSLSKEMEKPEGERPPGLSQEAVDVFKEELTYTYNDYYEPLDKALMLRTLKMADTLPAGQRITGLDITVFGSGMNTAVWVDNAYKTTRLNNEDYAKKLIGKSSAEIERINDPFIRLAVSLYPMAEEINKITNEFGSNVTSLRKDYVDALFEWKGSLIYPDANGTIRFTWGPVKGYKPADAVWYYPFTTLRGVVEKNLGIEPFNAPEKLVTLKDSKEKGVFLDPDLKEIPVAFLNQCDITGGNSGSPVMNAKGELTGLAFDGNYEAMISDWQYDYTLQRCIAVDIRYVLFITEKFSEAGFLLDEMGVKR